MKKHFESRADQAVTEDKIKRERALQETQLKLASELQALLKPGQNGGYYLAEALRKLGCDVPTELETGTMDDLVQAIKTTIRYLVESASGIVHIGHSEQTTQVAMSDGEEPDGASGSIIQIIGMEGFSQKIKEERINYALDILILPNIKADLLNGRRAEVESMLRENEELLQLIYWIMFFSSGGMEDIQKRKLQRLKKDFLRRIKRFLTRGQ